MERNGSSINEGAGEMILQSLAIGLLALSDRAHLGTYTEYMLCCVGRVSCVNSVGSYLAACLKYSIACLIHCPIYTCHFHMSIYM